MGLRDWWQAQREGFRFERNMSRFDNYVRAKLVQVEGEKLQAGAPAAVRSGTNAQLRELETREGLHNRHSAEVEHTRTSLGLGNHLQNERDPRARGIGAWLGRLFSGRLTKASREEAAKRDQTLGGELHWDVTDDMNKEMAQERNRRTQPSHDAARNRTMARARDYKVAMNPPVDAAGLRRTMESRGMSAEDAAHLSTVRDNALLYRPGEDAHNQRLVTLIEIRETANRSGNFVIAMDTPETARLAAEVARPFLNDFQQIRRDGLNPASPDYPGIQFQRVQANMNSLLAVSDFMGGIGKYGQGKLPPGCKSVDDFPRGYSRGWEALFGSPQAFGSYMEDKNKLAMEHNEVRKELGQFVKNAEEKIGKVEAFTVDGQEVTAPVHEELNEIGKILGGDPDALAKAEAEFSPEDLKAVEEDLLRDGISLEGLQDEAGMSAAANIPQSQAQQGAHQPRDMGNQR